MSAVEEPSGRSAPPPTAVRDRVDILIIDDTAAQRMAIETVLAELGEHVVGVEHGCKFNSRSP